MGVWWMLLACGSTSIRDAAGPDAGTDVPAVQPAAPVPVPEPPSEPEPAAKPSVTATLGKMNVLYLGVDNPLRVSVSGEGTDGFEVRGQGPIDVKTVGGGEYLVTASKLAGATITVEGPELEPTEFVYRIKRIPDPVAMVSHSRGGEMGSGEFRAQGGVRAVLENFDFDATCSVAGFELLYVATRQDVVTSRNPGARYNDLTRRLVNKAKPGDLYVFDDIRAKCPGDPTTRPIGTMAFRIR